MKYRTFYYCLLFLSVLSFAACKEKKTAKTNTYISLRSLIKEQVDHVDTALYSIVKVVTTDSLHNDTTYIYREDFEAEAKEFLEIPDLSDKKIASRYIPDSAIYDEMLNRVIITYNTTDSNEPYIKEQILVTPNPGGTDKVSSIIAVYSKISREGSIKKEMLWQLDKSFQVITTTRLPGQPEKTITKKVTWNDQPDE